MYARVGAFLMEVDTYLELSVTENARKVPSALVSYSPGLRVAATTSATRVLGGERGKKT